MSVLLKILFFAFWGFNGLLALTFFITAFAKIISPPSTQPNPLDKYVVSAGSAVIIGLLVWAFRLVIVHDKTGAGFAVTAISYLGWVGIQLAIIAIIAIKGNWDWK